MFPVSESVESIAMPEAILVDTLEDVMLYLEKNGILSQGGIFLTDVDKTLRDPVGDAKSLRFDRLPQETMDIIFKLQENEWDIAVVTNQPMKGHVISRVTQAIQNDYIRTTDFYKTHGISTFGPTSGPLAFPIEAAKNTISNMSEPGRIEEIGGLQYAPWYKSTDKSVEEVGEWVLAQIREKNSENIVWVGNTESDVAFAHRLHEYLREHDFDKELIVFKMPDGYGKLHPVSSISKF